MTKIDEIVDILRNNATIVPEALSKAKIALPWDGYERDSIDGEHYAALIEEDKYGPDPRAFIVDFIVELATDEFYVPRGKSVFKTLIEARVWTDEHLELEGWILLGEKAKL